MKDKKCCICLEEFQEQDSKFCDGCKKILHMDCIVNSGQARCPFCRKEVDIPDQYKEKIEEKRRELREYIESNNPDPLESLTKEELVNLILSIRNTNTRLRSANNNMRLANNHIRLANNYIRLANSLRFN